MAKGNKSRKMACAGKDGMTNHNSWHRNTCSRHAGCDGHSAVRPGAGGDGVILAYGSAARGAARGRPARTIDQSPTS